MTEAVRPALLEEGPHTYSPLGAALAAAYTRHMMSCTKEKELITMLLRHSVAKVCQGFPVIAQS